MNPNPNLFPSTTAAARPYRIPRAWLLPFALMLLVAAALLAFARPALAQSPADAADPPGRVARLNLAEGALSFAPAGSEQWEAAPYNRPLTSGDRLWAAEQARAEIDTGNALLRLDGGTSLALSEIDDDLVQLQLLQGTIAAHVESVYEDDRFEVDTPNLALVAGRAGDYRIDVDTARNETRVAVRSGSVRVYGERGDSLEMQAGQQLTFQGRQLSPVSGALRAGSDTFDRWVTARDQALAQSTAARYVSPGTVGYQQLDQYGNWQSSSEYGSVWYPADVPAGWAPYRYGQWNYVEPWGWTWVDDAPWGFAPFHYGRWVQSGSRWGWVPGPRVPRAAYAPALVGFGGAGGGGVHWRPGVGPGAGASWFPLAPGEPWRPGYQASQRYVDRINHGVHEHGAHRPGPDRFLYSGRPGAITSVDNAGWQGRHPVRVPITAVGFTAPPQAPFATPPAEYGRPWANGDQRRGPDRWQRGPQPELPAPIRNAQPMPKPQRVPGPNLPAPIMNAQPMPRPQPQGLPAQNRVAQDWQRFEQQQAQQDRAPQPWQQRQQERRVQEFQRGPDPAHLGERQRMQDQQRGMRQQQEQQEQQLRLQTEQRRREQDMQRHQFQQQQQQQQQQRFQSEQFQRQQQMREQMRQRQTQERVLRDHQMFERQQQQEQRTRDRQMRGPQPG